MRRGFICLDLWPTHAGAKLLVTAQTTTGPPAYRVVQNTDATGFGFVFGADPCAGQRTSVFLPSDRGYDLTSRPDRDCVPGVHWQGGRARRPFMVLTWLGKEYETAARQPACGARLLRLKKRYSDPKARPCAYDDLLSMAGDGF